MDFCFAEIAPIVSLSIPFLRTLFNM